MAAPSASKMNNEHNPWERKKTNQPPNIDELFSQFGKKYFKGGGAGQEPTNSYLFILIGFLLILWILSGFYTIKPAERGTLLRFGRYQSTVEPGLHWRAKGIDSLYVLNTNRIETWNYSAEMLTKDENYAKVALSVFYRIGNPKDYLFRVQDPVTSMENAVSSALRQVIGHTDLEAILTIGKEEARAQVEALVNEILDEYKTGIEVTDLKMQEATVPQTVIKAFDNVITAREEKAAKISQGERYVKGILPKALGKARRIIEESKAYQDRVILGAEADVARFLALLPQYKNDSQLLTDRLYLEMLQNVLGRVNKVYVKDSKSLLYLPVTQGAGAQLPGLVNEVLSAKKS